MNKQRIDRETMDGLKPGDVIVANVNQFTWRLLVTDNEGTMVYGEALEPCHTPIGYAYPAGTNLRVYFPNIVLVEVSE